MQRFSTLLTRTVLAHHKIVLAGIVLFTLITSAFLPWVTLDTDPENMLESNEPARIFHNQAKRQFNLSDVVVLGVVNETDPDGVYNPQTLALVYELTQFAKKLRWEDKNRPGGWTGVIEAEMTAPSMVDHMSREGAGTLKFEWLMPRPPKTREEALSIREKAMSNPLLKGRMIGEDGKAICIYLPLTDKLTSYRIYKELSKKIEELKGVETCYVSGLPVAEGAIGEEMFTQMGTASPLAMALIFCLLFIFFRRWEFVALPMLIATVSILSAMGMMIAFGFPVHILSSMLPIFLMSIAMVDCVHVLSEFFDAYTPEAGRQETIVKVLNTLFAPMLYTSLTTAAGFLSLTLAPIPPARVFGVFLCIGVMIAWGVTVLLAPAYIMLIPEKNLAHFGLSSPKRSGGSRLATFLQGAGRFTYHHAKWVCAFTLMLTALSIWGISQIQVNDNYAKRFNQDHPLRQADTALNAHFKGTYTAYLIVQEKEPRADRAPDPKGVEQALLQFAHNFSREYPRAPSIAEKIIDRLPLLASRQSTQGIFLAETARFIRESMSRCLDEDLYILEEFAALVSMMQEELKPFKNPEILLYLRKLQTFMEQQGLVGKCVSAADVVCKVNQELTDGKEESYTIPNRLRGVSECFMQYQQSHRPNDLWHMVTPDYMQANIWMQFPTGNSKDMKAAVKAVDAYFATHTPPVGLNWQWAGLHYINSVLETRLVWGFLKSLAGSFLIVFFMMTFLFRSPVWAALCMMPLSVTLLVIYGLTGFTGKDYDLPIAVLSALSIGMAVDFAIHFLERSRTAYRQTGSWRDASPVMFKEPARAITRNVLILAIGFLPLVTAPLIPYKTTGVMLFLILFCSGLVTLLALPSFLTLMEPLFFRAKKEAGMDKNTLKIEPLSEKGVNP